MNQFVSRAGDKLDFALTEFEIDPSGLVAADFGSSTGGFVDCLLYRGASKVYSVDTSYGELAWKLRNDNRVVVMERTNAMHVNLPEKVDLVTIDTSWTKQVFVLPSAINNLKKSGLIISLVKLHYESPKKFLVKGRLKEENIDEVVAQVENEIKSLNLKILKTARSPILGEKGKNIEMLFLIKSG